MGVRRPSGMSGRGCALEIRNCSASPFSVHLPRFVTRPRGNTLILREVERSIPARLARQILSVFATDSCPRQGGSVSRIQRRAHGPANSAGEEPGAQPPVGRPVALDTRDGPRKVVPEGRSRLNGTGRGVPALPYRDSHAVIQRVLGMAHDHGVNVTAAPTIGAENPRAFDRF
jgi:hypothetical protein